MNRLQAELQRLYLLPAPPPDPDGGELATRARLISPDGQVRALLLELARPADWAPLAAVWQGVQADLALPAPAIAVSGMDGYQLWFALAEPVGAGQAWTFLNGLRQRYLGQLAAARLRWWPASSETSDEPALPDAAEPQRAPPLPGRQHSPGQWSAFIAPDLAPVFGTEPWLDLCPSPDAQADLLSRLQVMRPAAFAAALQRLAPESRPLQTGAHVPGPAAPQAGAAARPVPAAALAGGPAPGPRQFLLQLMNDPGAAMRLRIEAAKALLPHLDG